MLKHYLILAVVLSAGSILASQAAPEYPAFQEEMRTALNNICRAQKGTPFTQDELAVANDDLKMLINKHVTFADNILSDLKQQQKEMAGKLANNPSDNAVEQQIKKVAFQIAALEKALEEIAPAVDTSAHRGAQPKVDAQPRPTIMVVVAVPRRSEPNPATAPEFLPNPDLINSEQLLKTLAKDHIFNDYRVNGFNNKLLKYDIFHNHYASHKQAYVSQPSVAPSAAGNFDALREQQAEVSFQNLKSTIESTLRSPQVSMPARAIVAITDYAQQDWIKPQPSQPKVPAFQAPAGYDENEALRRALEESAAATSRTAAERDLKEAHPPAPANLSSAASYGVPARPAARPSSAAAAQPISAREQAAIDEAVRLSLREIKEREEKERKLKQHELNKWTQPAFVVPHIQHQPTDGQDLQATLSRYKEAFLLAGIATTAAALAYFTNKFAMQ